MRAGGLTVLAVDDEAPALADLTWMLRAVADVEEVITARGGAEALRLVAERDVDAVLLDIQMAGLDGLELARVLRNFATPPVVAFVTAYDEHAVEAFELAAVDYLLKPVDAERLRETMARIRARSAPEHDRAGVGGLARLETRVGRRRVLVERDDVVVVEAEGGYAKVHRRKDPPVLVNETLSSLTCAWASHGFVRIHRSFLVRASSIREMQVTDGRRSVRVGDRELPVSRRYAKLLQQVLAERA